MNYKLDTSAGNDFNTVAEKAKQISTEKNVIVEFEFNGVTCLVSKDTNLDWLYRDYSNSWTMEWKQVGFDCPENYNIEVQSEFEKRTKQREEKRQHDDLNDLCKQHCEEGVTGSISFTKGFYIKLCKHLGIKYGNLSRTGKAVLKSHAIDTVNMRYSDNFNDGFYYEKF